MAENAGHGPGSEIKGEGGAVRQRFSMGEGKGVMAASDFGVDPLPGTKTSRAASTAGDNKILSDSERAGPPGIDQGKGAMRATSHSYHGAHDCE